MCLVLLLTDECAVLCDIKYVQSHVWCTARAAFARYLQIHLGLRANPQIAAVRVPQLK